MDYVGKTDICSCNTCIQHIHVFWALAGAEALSSSDSLSLKDKDVLNAKNARSYFLPHPDFPQNPRSTDLVRLNNIKHSFQSTIRAALYVFEI